MGSAQNVLKQSKQELRILILGLDNAGKTTILKAISKEDQSTTQPTQGLNAKTVYFGKSKLSCFDIGGQESVRQYWNRYFKGTNCLIFVVDAADEKRLDEVEIYLNVCLDSEELRGVPVLVFSNKSDIPSALKPSEVAQRLKLTRIRGHAWQIYECCALDGTGIEPGFEWAIKYVNESK